MCSSLTYKEEPMRYLSSVTAAVLFACGTTAASAETDDRWWEKHFSRPSARQGSVYTPQTRIEREYPRSRPTIVAETVDPKGPIILEPMPATVRYQGKLVVIFLDSQQFAAYDKGAPAILNGKVFQGPVSTGSPGHETTLTDPKKGLDTIGLRQVDYVSNTYPEPDGGAPMPHAQFFNNYGEAMHAGYVNIAARARRRNRGDSHGCVRLMPSQAKAMYFEFYEPGMRVIVVESVAAFQSKWEQGYFVALEQAALPKTQ